MAGQSTMSREIAAILKFPDNENALAEIAAAQLEAECFEAKARAAATRIVAEKLIAEADRLRAANKGKRRIDNRPAKESA